MLYNAATRKFYSYILSEHPPEAQKTLVGRSRTYARKYEICLTKYIFSDTYSDTCKQHFKFPVNDGLIDTVRFLLLNPSPERKAVLETLLKPF